MAGLGVRQREIIPRIRSLRSLHSRVGRELGFSSNFVKNLDEIIRAIEKTYEMRRDASEGVLHALNSDVELSEEDRGFKLHFGSETLEFDLEIVEALGSQITIKSSDLGTIREVG